MQCVFFFVNCVIQGRRRDHNERFVLCNIQVRKNSLNIKFLGGIFLGHPGPRSRDIPDKNFMQVAFFCCFRQGVAGMSRDLGRDVPDLEKLYARKLWADFLSFAICIAESHLCDARHFHCYLRSPCRNAQ